LKASLTDLSLMTGNMTNGQFRKIEIGLLKSIVIYKKNKKDYYHAYLF